MVDERRGIERQRDGEMARRRDGAMDKTTAEAKAKDVDEPQEDGRAAKGRSATRGDRRETADVVGQETAKTADC